MKRVTLIFGIMISVMSCSDNSSETPVNSLNKEKYKDSIIENLSHQFLKKNAVKQGVKVTKTGLQYLVLKEGVSSQHPTSKDRVKVHYHGTLIDGTVFDSSVERRAPISFTLNQVIEGWSEGLQLMTIGGKTRFFIPSKLAYGQRGAGKLIRANATLIFEIELLGIN